MKVCTAFFIFSLILYLQYNANAREWKGPVTDAPSGKTYYVSMEKASKKTAETLCKNNDWILATVKSRSQQLIIKNLAIANHKYDITDDIWIGLKLTIDRERGTWSDGSEILVPDSGSIYSNWTIGEPRGRGNGTCVQMWKREYYTWDDAGCGEMKRFACEGKAPTSSTDVQQKADRIINEVTSLKGNKQNAELVSLSVNELLNANEEYFGNASNTSWMVVKSVDDFLSRYNRTENGNFEINMPNFEMKVQKGKNTPVILRARNIDDDKDINIILNRKLLVDARRRDELHTNRTLDDVQVNSVLYKTISLFQVNKDLYKPLLEYNDTASETFARNLTTPMFGDDPVFKLQPRVLSSVLSAAIKNVDMSSLKHPLRITMPTFSKNHSVPQLTNKKARCRILCGYWDFKINDWSTKGCVTISPVSNTCNTRNDKENDTVVCKCNHMTHFSVLLDVTYSYAPRYLTDMTIAGCTLSIACLLATIVTILLFKQLRSKTPQQILLNLCINLLVVNLMFLIGIDRVNDETFCKATAIMLHYFLLAAWAWMLVEAIFLLLSLVVPCYSGGVRGKIVPVSVILAYGLPAIIVGITAGVAGMKAYINEKYCWLAKDILIKSLVVPIAIVLSINTVIFCLTIYSISCRSKMFRKNLSSNKLRQTLKRACAMLFILGIPWIFGYLMLLSQNDQQKEVFAIMFTVFNTTQGVAIFVLFCVRQETVRKLWLEPLGNRFRQSIRKIRPAVIVERRENETKETDKSNTNNTNTIDLDDTKTTKCSTENLDQIEEKVIENRPFRSGW